MTVFYYYPVKGRIMRALLLLMSCLVFTPGTLPANDVPVKKILLSSLDDYEVKAQEQRAEFLKKGSYPGIPFIDDIELRLRDESYDINLLRYTVRIQPRGFGETSAAGRYNRSITGNSQLKFQLRKNAALKDRYLLIINSMEQNALLGLYDDLILLYEDRIKVMENKSNSLEFGLNDLIEAEDANTKLKTHMFDIKKTLGLIERKIAYSIGDSLFSGIDTGGFADLDTIITFVEEDHFALDTNNVYLDYFRHQIRMAENRYNLEKAERRRYISFLGFSYDNGGMLDEFRRKGEGDEYDLDNAYALELGVKIPDLTMARHDIARRKMDYIAEQEDYDATKRELGEQIKKDQEDLHVFIAQYRFLKARENEVDATSSLKKYLQMSGVDPLVLLSIKESIIKNRIEIARLKFSILRNYIQVIDVAGQLSKPPLRNFLSKTQEIIQP
jgi:hypothetical protein